MRRILSIVAVFLVVACNSVLDIPEAHPKTGLAPDVKRGNGTCPDGQKDCGGKCVKTDDPATGCGTDSCGACQLAHATATCGKDGSCAIAACQDNFRNCNEQTVDGCEADVSSDSSNCGECGNACGGSMKCEEWVCKCHADADCAGDKATCGTGADDLGRCYCSDNGQPCSAGSACDGQTCAF